MNFLVPSTGIVDNKSLIGGAQVRRALLAMLKITAIIISVVLIQGVASASVWIESTSAGRTLAGAQNTTGTGSLDWILGSLDDNSPDTGKSVDLFRIRIVNPLIFSAATTAAPGFYVDDPQLFLFDSLGRAVYMNDDDESGFNGSQSLLPAGHPFGPTSIGLYYLGIAWFDNEPVSSLGLMFSNASANGTNGPALAGGSPLVTWNDNVTQRIDLPTYYEIELTGAAFAIPEPATGLLVIVPLAALALYRRTRS